MSTQQNTQTKPAPATQQAETPQPINGYKSKIRFPLPMLFPLSDDEKEKLQILLVILRRHEGSITPIEEFIRDLVLRYGHHPVTLDDIEQAFDVLAQNWQDAINITKRCNEDYPELVTPAKEKQQQLVRDAIIETIESTTRRLKDQLRAGKQVARS